MPGHVLGTGPTRQSLVGEYTVLALLVYMGVRYGHRRLPHYQERGTNKGKEFQRKE